MGINMITTIGTHYHNAESNNVETIDYYENSIEVLSNKFDGDLAVVQQLPDVQGIETISELYKSYNLVTTEMTVLESLGYDLDFCDDGCAFWSKQLSE